MKLSVLRRARVSGLPGITAVVRVDRRTHSLAKRARAGEIAVIDHLDIDRGAAEALVRSGVSVVLNVAPSISGRYPNQGPSVLLDAGVVLVDQVDSDAFSQLSDGDVVRVDGDSVYLGDQMVATGVLQTRATVDAALEASKDGMADQLEAFSVNAVEHLRREQALLLDGEGVPAVRTSFEGHQVLVVSKAFDYRAEVASLRTFIRENSPILVAVDAGADALLEAGYRPTLVITALNDISDAALRCGAEVVAHAGTDGRVAGADRLERLGVSYVTFTAAGTTEDAAILLAHAHHAELIVVAGSHTSLVEFLDRGRSSMASSFLTRAAVGSSVVDAKAVARLYRNRVRGWLVLALVLLGICAVLAAIATTPVGQGWWDDLRSWADDAYVWVKERVS
jgi:uncharacterized membrane-anchored protein